MKTTNQQDFSGLKVKDYAVSGETFTLVFDDTLKCLKTQPWPDLSKLPSYYNSEDYISHTDHKRNLKERLYAFVKRFALKGKLNLIESFKTEGKQLLDVGCGTGDFLKTCANHHWQVTGIEPNAKARELAMSKLGTKIFDTSYLVNLPEAHFDVITLWHVMEHLPNLQEDLHQLKKLLKPNGIMLIAVPNYESFDAAYYKEFWAAFDVPRHLWHFSKESIVTLFSILEMKVYKIKPMHFDAFYVSLLSEFYKTGSYNYIKAFYKGWQSNRRAKTTGAYSSLIYVIKKH